MPQRVLGDPGYPLRWTCLNHLSWLLIFQAEPTEPTEGTHLAADIHFFRSLFKPHDQRCGLERRWTGEQTAWFWHLHYFRCCPHHSDGLPILSSLSCEPDPKIQNSFAVGHVTLQFTLRKQELISIPAASPSAANWKSIIDFVTQREHPVFTNKCFISFFENELQSTKEKKSHAAESRDISGKTLEAGGPIQTLNDVTLSLCHILEGMQLVNIITYIHAFML